MTPEKKEKIKQALQVIQNCVKDEVYNDVCAVIESSEIVCNDYAGCFYYE